MGKEYSIGETAALLNISRDALRFYEKKKLVMPRKRENGYRYYTEADIRILLDLICWRKAQWSIEDIRSMYDEGGPAYMGDLLTVRIEEEKKRIQEHKMMLRKLYVLQYAGKKITEGLNEYRICSIPRTYILSEMVDTYDEVRELWFAKAKNPGMEHCVLHEQYTVEEGALTYKCYLALEEYPVKKLKLDEVASQSSWFQFAQCVNIIYEAESDQVDWAAIEAMKRWAAERGICLTGEIHAHYLWNNQRRGELLKSYIQLYMPVKISK